MRAVTRHGHGATGEGELQAVSQRQREACDPHPGRGRTWPEPDAGSYAESRTPRNERRERSENKPYGKEELRLPELLYPAGHPYHHPIIGSHEDLEAATVDDVKTFFREYYAANNLSLVLRRAAPDP